MTILADQYDVVIGVDTHKHTHTAAASHAVTGAHYGTWTITTNPEGFATLVAHVDHDVAGRRYWAIEGCGRWGKGLARWLTEHGERVVEADRPKRPARRNAAKDDAIDALRAAREAIATEHHATPRQGTRRDALAAVVSARRSARAGATDAERQLLGLVSTTPEHLAAQVRGKSTAPAARPATPHQEDRSFAPGPSSRASH